MSSLEALRPGPFDIMQPVDQKNVINKGEIDLWLVPGLAFTKKGLRLGHGKGIYDRLLTGSKGEKIGVCFDFQMVNELPTEDWDVSVDIVLYA